MRSIKSSSPIVVVGVSQLDIIGHSSAACLEATTMASLRCSLLCSILVFFFFFLDASSAQDDLELSVTVDKGAWVSSEGLVRVACVLGQGRIMPDNTCWWTEPSGTTYVADVVTGEVVVAEDDAGEGNFTADGRLTAYGDESTCGIQFTDYDNDSEDDQGRWSCTFRPDGADEPFVRATFLMVADQDLENLHATDVRLPRHAQPHFYRLTLTPLLDGEDSRVDGSVELDFTFEPDLEEDSGLYADKLVLHMKDVLVDEASVNVSNVDGSLDVVGHEYDPDREFYIVHLGSQMSSETFLNMYTASMEFTSTLREGAPGFSRRPYIDMETEEIKYLLMTDSEPIDARRIMPMMDEPNMKASFSVAIGRDENQFCASNMESVGVVEDENLPEGFFLEEFAQTPAMSTYLLAAMVAEDFVKTPSEGDERIAVWHRPGVQVEEKMELALEAGPIVLTHYEEYTGIDFALDKLDFVAIPEFNIGGMENWGLITYNEERIAYKPGVSDYNKYDLAVKLVAHETAHMWFGDLVTMDWWNDLWLNEGFARYFEHPGVDAFDPEISSLERMVLRDCQLDAFMADSLASSVPVSNAGLINPRYDDTPGSITYEKAACLVRMMEYVLGADVLQDGIHDYLAAHADANAVRTDLWAALSAAAVDAGAIDEDFDFAAAMDTWTVQPGYPVVTASETDGDTVSLEQTRFFRYPEDYGGPDSDELLWTIPVSMTHPGDEDDGDNLVAWMENKTEEFAYSQRPFIVNFQERGFFRVNYDESNWLSLADAIEADQDSVDKLNRAQIVDDSLNLARAHLLGYDLALSVAASVARNETEYIPLESFISGISYVGKMLRQNPAVYGYFKEFAVDMLLDNYESLTFQEGDDDVWLTKATRDTVIRAMCLYEYQDCLDETAEALRVWMEQNDPDSINPINVNLRETVYQAAGRQAGRDEYDFLLARLEVAARYGTTDESKRLHWALASVEDEELLLDLLDSTIARNSPFRREDVADLIYATVAASAKGRYVQFRWLSENYDDVKDYFGGYFGEVLDAVVGTFAEDANFPSDISEVYIFEDLHDADVGDRFDGPIANAVNNEAWVESNFADISAWLAERYGDIQLDADDGGEDASREMALTVIRPEYAVYGTEQNISCVLGLDNVLVDPVCLFYAPLGTIVRADISTGNVTSNSTGDLLEEYTAFGDSATCGLTIASVDESDVGDWTCGLNEEAEGVPFHRGSFYFTTVGEFQEDVELPGNADPSTHELDLTILPDELSVTGSMRLHFNYVDVGDFFSDKVYVHADGIQIQEDAVSLYNFDVTIPIAGHEYDVDRDFYVLHLAEPMTDEEFLNDYTLEMGSFASSAFDRPAEGLFYADFGGSAPLMVTDFEKTGARTVFPCMDEPSYRASYFVNVTHDADYFVLFNAAASMQESVGENTVLEVFDSTARLPAYQLAFFLASYDDFASVSGPLSGLNSTVNVVVWYRSVFAEEQASLSAELASSILAALSQYSEVSFPQDKLDLVALPETRAEGGRGANYGLMTFQESTLLFDPTESSLDDLDRLVSTMSQEMAELWVGGVVGIESWSELWLKEGFSRYLGLKAAEAVQPTLHQYTRAVGLDLHEAMIDDSLLRMRSMENDVENPDFDSPVADADILAAKAGWLLRMAEAVAGQESFQTALNQLLSENAFTSVDQDLFWSLLDAAAAEEGTLTGRNLSEVMKTWTSQDGFPVVTFEVSGTTLLTLTQEQLVDEDDADPYSVPVTVFGPGCDFNGQIHWLQGDAPLEISISERPYLANYQQQGYYRVNYDEQNWLDLIDLMGTSERDSVDPVARAQLYDDALNLARAGELDYEVALAMATTLTKEQELLPLQSALRAFEHLDLMLRDSENAYSYWKAYVTTILTRAYESVGFDPSDDDTYETVWKRNLLVRWMCLYEYDDCTTRAINAFSDWMDLSPEAENPIDVDQRATVYQAAIRDGGEANFLFLLDQLEQAETEGDAEKILFGLSATGESDQVRTLLDMTLDGASNIRRQNAMIVFRQVALTSVGRSVQFEWMVENYHTFKSYFGATFEEAAAAVLSGYAAGSSHAADISELEAFVESDLVGGDLTAVSVALEMDLERARGNEEWAEGNFGKVDAWLQANPPPDIATTTTTEATDSTSATESTVTDSTVTDSTVTDSTVTDSTVTDSTVTDSTGTDSTVTDSTVTDSTVTDSTVTDSTVTDSTVTDSTVTDSTVTDSTVTDSTVTDSTVTDSTVTDSTGTDSTVTDSTVTDSTVTDSTVTDGTVTESTVTESTVPDSTSVSGSTESTAETASMGTDTTSGSTPDEGNGTAGGGGSSIVTPSIVSTFVCTLLLTLQLIS